MRVVVVPHDPAWQRLFNLEAREIAERLGSVVVRIHHIGSTSIPGLPAKPTIDILIEAVDLESLDAAIPFVEALGYQAMGEYGIPRRRYFRKDDGFGRRTHQVHAFEAGSDEILRHLAFRDYMIAHPSAAEAYGALKQALALTHPDDIEAYMVGKDAFVKRHQAHALTWWSRTRNLERGTRNPHTGFAT